MTDSVEDLPQAQFGEADPSLHLEGISNALPPESMIDAPNEEDKKKKKKKKDKKDKKEKKLKIKDFGTAENSQGPPEEDEDIDNIISQNQ